MTKCSVTTKEGILDKNSIYLLLSREKYKFIRTFNFASETPGDGIKGYTSDLRKKTNITESPFPECSVFFYL